MILFFSEIRDELDFSFAKEGIYCINVAAITFYFNGKCVTNFFFSVDENASDDL